MINTIQTNSIKEDSNPILSSTTSWSCPSTPITGSYGKLERDTQEVWDDMIEAFRQGNYAEALAKAEQLEESCERFLERVEFVVNHFLKGEFAGGRAYFLALQQKKEALTLCEAAFDKLSAGLDEFLALSHDSGWGRETEFTKVKEGFENTHLLFRGFIELSIGEREKGIADLKSALNPLSLDGEDRDAIETCFLYKVLEQKLGTKILPEPTSVDPTDAASLFWAGRYEEALQILDEISEPKESVRDWFAEKWQKSQALLLKGACLSLLGRTAEALHIFEREDSSYVYFDRETMTVLTHLQKGDFAEAKSGCISDSQTQFLIPMPSLFMENSHFLRHLLPLAIRAFEN